MKKIRLNLMLSVLGLFFLMCQSNAQPFVISRYLAGPGQNAKHESRGDWTNVALTLGDAGITGKVEYQSALLGGSDDIKIPKIYLRNKYTGRYLSLKDLNDKSGNDIVQWSTKGDYQQWALVPVTNKNDGWFFLVNGKTERLATSTGTGNGANVDQGVFRVESRKQVRLYKPRGVGNYYQIIFRNSNKALDVAGFSKSSGASVKQYYWNRSFGGKKDSQLWEIIYVDFF